MAKSLGTAHGNFGKVTSFLLNCRRSFKNGAKSFETQAPAPTIQAIHTQTHTHTKHTQSDRCEGSQEWGQWRNFGEKPLREYGTSASAQRAAQPPRYTGSPYPLQAKFLDPLSSSLPPSLSLSHNQERQATQRKWIDTARPRSLCSFLEQGAHQLQPW